MTTLLQILKESVPLVLILLGALFIIGLINKVRALLAGRKGYRFFQPLLRVCVLVHKGEVYSTVSTALTRVAPAAMLAVTVVAAAIVPLGTFPALIHFDGDFILFAFLMAFAKLVMVLAALDSGGAFQGMGSAREVFFSMLIEPCFFLLIGTLALVTGQGSFSAIFATFDNRVVEFLVLSLVLGYAFFNIALVENGRLPVDDPRTHLELTMIHEAMILDLSGVDLAFVQIGGWIKLSIYGMLTVNALIPAGIVGWRLVVWFAVAVVAYSALIGLIESMMARNRMPKNAAYLATISAIGLLGFVVAYVLMMNA